MRLSLAGVLLLSLTACSLFNPQPDDSSSNKMSAEKRTEYMEGMKITVRNFADLIAGEIRKTNAFEEVGREPAAGDSLRISGVITRYTPGNAALRFLIGLGAGSSYFDATVNLSDNTSGEQLGQVIVDKNSWGLGGGLAAGQTVEHFMQGAAEKIANDLKESKLGSAASTGGR